MIKIDWHAAGVPVTAVSSKKAYVHVMLPKEADSTAKTTECTLRRYWKSGGLLAAHCSE